MLYNITSNIQTNMVLNKGLLELGGVAVPNTIMANNKTEARERAEREGLYFAFAFLAPFVFLPLFNRWFLKLNKVTGASNGFDHKIMNLSKKYLTKDGKYLEEGMSKLLEKFKTKKDANYEKINDSFKNILKKFPDKEVLRKKLIRAHSDVMFSDIVISGIMLGSVPWISNFITQIKTGKKGFSAKFEMVDDKKLREDAKAHERTKMKKIAILLSSIFLSAGGLYAGFKKGMSAKESSKFSNFVKKYADTLDYKDGIFMSRTMLLLLTLCSDFPGSILSGRDKDEVKYAVVRNLILNGMFFGGDIILNGLAGNIIDKSMKTKLMDDSTLKDKNNFWKRITCPLRTFEDINKNEIKLDEKTLQKTKKAGVGMFWGNFLLLCALIGFGMPAVLNKNLKRDVKNDADKLSTQSNQNELQYNKAFKDFKK